MMHIDLVDGVEAAAKIIAKPEYQDSPVTLHIVSDLRQQDWGLPQSEPLIKELLTMVKQNKDLKILPIDTVHPQRGAVAGAFPTARDNIGILDVRPSTRIVGKNMPVQCNIKIMTFSGKQVEVMLVARNEVTGADMRDVNSNPQNPIRLSPGVMTNVSFQYHFNESFFDGKEFKPNQSYFAHMSIRLTNQQLQPLNNDGLAADNIRYTAVEVRQKVPILVVDGENVKGSDENGDSFFINRCLRSVPGASYQVVYGDELGQGESTRALERPDLSQYPTIFMLNVRELKKGSSQLKNLENFVKDGGGVAFFLGPLVNAEYYNKELYNGGKGIFPAPLKAMIPPRLDDPEMKKEDLGSTYELLVREEKFQDLASVPIFGPMLRDEPKMREAFRFLLVKRYYQVNRNSWRQEPNRVAELATLPNDASILTFPGAVLEVT